MKSLYRNIIIIFVLVLSVLLVGCGEPAEYIEANYTMTAEYEFEKELTTDEAIAALKSAREYFATAKSYSYTQTMTGEYESQYSYQGVTKIDATGATPLASIELTGTTNYGFYIADNKAYLNYDGYKTYYEINSNFDEFLTKAQESLGAFVSFDENILNTNQTYFAGVDDSETTVICFALNDAAKVMVVINSGKIMKVIYENDDAVSYTAVYDYNPVTVTLPSDLDSYIKK